MSTTAPQSLTFKAVVKVYIDSILPSADFRMAGMLRADTCPIQRSSIRLSDSDLNGRTVKQVHPLLYANSSFTSGLRPQTVSDDIWGETSISSNNVPTVSTTSSGQGVTFEVTSYILAAGNYVSLSPQQASQASAWLRESGSNSPKLVVDLNT